VDKIEQLPVGSALVQTPEMRYALQTRMYPPTEGHQADPATDGQA
jgi:hypothetical protein